MDKKLLEECGFGEYFIHNVPMGVIFNAQNADSFPLISSGAYINPEKQLMIEPDLRIPDPRDIYPWRMRTLYNGRRSNGGIFWVEYGTFDELLEKSKLIAIP